MLPISVRCQKSIFCVYLNPWTFQLFLSLDRTNILNPVLASIGWNLLVEGRTIRIASRSSSAIIVASSTVRDCALQLVSISVPWNDAVRQGVNVTVGASKCAF